MQTEAESAKSTFESLGLCKELLDAVRKVGYTTPTEIQRQSIPYGIEGRDLICLAETGSGKTASFALPVIHRLLQNPQPYFALVLAPTR
jgi:ATP-dependent RNA helicase DDX47/RRP3